MGSMKSYCEHPFNAMWKHIPEDQHEKYLKLLVKAAKEARESYDSDPKVKWVKKTMKMLAKAHVRQLENMFENLGKDETNSED